MYTLLRAEVFLFVFGKEVGFQNRTIRDPGVLPIGHGDLPGITPGINDSLLDLPVCHPDCKLIPVLHGNRQSLFSQKRKHADQSPVSAFNCAAVNLIDLFSGQIRAVFTLQTIGLLQSANATLLISLPCPDQVRIREFHICHISHEFSGFLTHNRVIQVDRFFIIIAAAGFALCATVVCTLLCSGAGRAFNFFFPGEVPAITCII